MKIHKFMAQRKFWLKFLIEFSLLEIYFLFQRFQNSRMEIWPKLRANLWPLSNEASLRFNMGLKGSAYFSTIGLLGFKASLNYPKFSSELHLNSLVVDFIICLIKIFPTPVFLSKARHCWWWWIELILLREKFCC